MFLLGIGTAFPSHSLSDSDLVSLGLRVNSRGDSVAQRAGVSSRRISLPLDYIRATGNVDVLEGWKVATHSPTGLAVEAVRVAIAQAGIGIESVGLIVADTATPYQTCPSEAQRVAGEYGLKIPAYDVVRGVSAFPHFLEMFASWKVDRVPDYCVCISTNTPSQHVRFKDDAIAAELFGDAACAIVISKKHVSSIRVLHSSLTCEMDRAPTVVVTGPLAVKPENLVERESLRAFIVGELDQLQRLHPTISSSALFIPPQMFAAEAADILREQGVSAERVVSGVADRGFSLGSAYGVALASTWDRLKTGKPVVMLHCGDGLRGTVVVGSESGRVA